ncbi:MAG: asparagine--tRNA ligase [Bdellovibrionales bacterium]|nr:asparagine--tRNA ligase [Bdellovibrionales bacterium]
MEFADRQPIRISDVHDEGYAPGRYFARGWVKTHRRSKNVAFIELTDGTSVKGLQLVINPSLSSYLVAEAQIGTGAAIEVSGQLVPSPAKGQKFEFQVEEFSLVGSCDPETYPLQKKGHTLEFLREQLHLRPRSNTLGAVFRIRSAASFAVHKFFRDRNFIWVHTPIITTSDCEGAGEMFRVTTLDLSNPPRDDKGHIDFSQDFFKDEASLTVSGQLEAEIFALSHMNCYTFGPTFRSENSNTSRHLSEFWMIEPEMAFCDLRGDMKVAEDFVKEVVRSVLQECAADLEFLHAREWVEADTAKVLEQVSETRYGVMTYDEVINELQKSGRKFEYEPHWGADLQAEHERFITDEVVKGPTFVINYPKEIKAFYMRLNEDEKTVAAMDLLVPRLGEIIGGSQREEREAVLRSKIEANGMPPELYWWYLELRKFGGVPHAGFGLGFERLLMYLTGIQNIRDVIPFPRHPGYAKF